MSQGIPDQDLIDQYNDLRAKYDAALTATEGIVEHCHELKAQADKLSDHPMAEQFNRRVQECFLGAADPDQRQFLDAMKQGIDEMGVKLGLIDNPSR